MNRANAHRGLASAKLFDTALWTFAALLAVIALILSIDWLTRIDTFPVRAVRFEGTFAHVTREQLNSAVMDKVRDSFVSVDLDVLKTRVEQVPWVQSASVRRAWPRDIYVRFTEQQLVARWNDNQWVNQALEAVNVPVETPPDVPHLEGPAGTQAQVYARYRELSDQLAEAGLGLNRLTLTSRRTWRLELDNGVALVLDRDEVDHKVERFVQAWPALARDGRAIQQVDLRYTNGFAVLWGESG